MGRTSYKMSEEHKKKIGDAHRGKKKKYKIWNKGKKIGFIPPCAFKKGHKINAGEKHYRWKGGITPINKKIRKSLEYKFWRKECFERDNFVCQKTGQVGGKLVVHHINNFAEFPELRFEVKNGITLSLEAHKEFHRRYGIKNNTSEQLIEFLNTNESK
jgi:hypothetical protein